MDAKKRYASLYHIARKAIGPYIRHRYSFTTDTVPEIEGPFLLLSNHTTEDDMLFTAAACEKPMYFVCGEHLLRNKHYGKLLRTMLNPVAIPKGGSTLPAVLQMLRRLRSGDSLCMFYEGKRSYHGETIPPSEALGALVKKAGCTLVTYRIQGGYFTYPRWSRNNKRKGHTEGKVMGVYPPGKLATLTPEEITALIARDTYENAYATQREKQWEYTGKNLARGLETVLFLCPCCKGEDTLQAEGNRFFCSRCGLSGEYTTRGFLVGERLPYDNVLDWMRWEEPVFDALVLSRDSGTPLYTLENIELYRMEEDYTNTTLCRDTLRIFRDRLEIQSRSFPLEKIPYASVLFGNILLFTYGDTYYGLTGDTFKAWKCARLWHLIKGDTHDRTKEI